MKNLKDILLKLTTTLLCVTLFATIGSTSAMDSAPATGKAYTIATTASSTINTPGEPLFKDNEAQSFKVTSLKDQCLEKLAMLIATPNEKSFGSSLVSEIRQEYKNEQIKSNTVVQNLAHSTPQPQPKQNETLNHSSSSILTAVTPSPTAAFIPRELTHEEMQGVLNENITELPLCDLLNLVMPIVDRCDLRDKLCKIIGANTPAVSRIELKNAPEPQHPGRSIYTLSPNGKLMTMECEGQHTLWSLITGEPIQIPITGHAEQVYKIIFSPNNKHLVTESSDVALIWSLSAEKLFKNFSIEEGAEWGRNIVFSPEGAFMTSKSQGETILWNLATEMPTKVSFPEHDQKIESIIFGSNDKFIIANYNNYTSILWDLSAGKPSNPFSFTWRTSYIINMTFSPDHKFLATTSRDWRLLLWDLIDRQQINIPAPSEGPQFCYSCINFHADSKFMITQSSYGTVDLWNLSTGQPVKIAIAGDLKPVRPINFSPDGKFMTTVTDDEKLRIWDLTTGQPVHIPIEGHTKAVLRATFSPNGKFLVTRSGNEAIFWNISEGKPVNPFTIIGHTNELRDVIFTSNKHMATLSMEEVILWDLSSGKPTNPVIITGHICTHATLSPDNLFLATHSRAQSVLWSLKPNLTLEQTILLKLLTKAQPTIKEPINLGSQITALYQTLPAGIQEKFKDKVILDPARATSQPTQSETPTNILDEPAADLTVVPDTSVEPLAAAKTTMEELD